MTKERPLRDAGIALSLLTVVPTGARLDDHWRSGAAGWFPAVGLLLGSLAAGLLWAAGDLLSGKALLAASILVALPALLSRFLHWDGLADVADAWWGGADPQRRLEIMKDSATGAFGVTALVLTGLLQVSSLAALAPAGATPVILCVPVFGRLAATFAAWLGQPACDGGLGRSVMGRPRPASALAAVVTVGAAAWVLMSAGGMMGVAGAVVGVVSALVVPHLISARMGGVTGDVMGAAVMVVETLLYVTAAIAWRSVA